MIDLKTEIVSFYQLEYASRRLGLVNLKVKYKKYKNNS